MLNDKSQRARVSASLHNHYDRLPVPANLARRVESVLNADADQEKVRESFNLGRADIRRTRPGRQRIAVLASAAAVAAVVAVGAVLIHGQTSAPNVGRQPAPTRGKSSITACSSPASPFAHFYIYNRYGADAGAYAGIVQVGSAKVPTSSIYASNGPAGTGYLCLSNTTGASKTDPVRAFLTPQNGPIRYLGLIDGDQPWGAVDPNVTSIVISASGQPDDSYTLTSPDDQRLRPIGGGWHVFNSWSGFSGIGPISLTVKAYAGSTLVDTRSIETVGARSSQTSPTPTG